MAATTSPKKPTTNSLTCCSARLSKDREETTVNIVQQSLDDAKHEVENLYVAWVESFGTGRNRRLDAKNALLAYVNEWVNNYPSRQKKMSTFLNLLIEETFGEVADEAAADLGV
jgi:hypothetical protein